MVDAHMSASLTIPTLSFRDIYFDGEQYEGLWHGDRDPWAVLPLDKFRAEFMGHQCGLHSDFLVYTGHPFTLEEGLALSLIRGVMVRPLGGGRMLESISHIWKVMDDFGAEEAEWLPYWENQEVVRSSPKDVKVSLYLRRGKGVLLVAANIGPKDVIAQLGLTPSRLKAVDALTQEPFPLKRVN